MIHNYYFTLLFISLLLLLFYLFNIILLLVDSRHYHLCFINIYLQSGVKGKALEVILRKVFGPNGLFKEILKGKVSMADLLKPLTKPDMGGLDRKIKEVLEKVYIFSSSQF